MPDSDAMRGVNGMTDPETRQVLVRTDMDSAAQVKTLAHELAHVRMHGPNQQEARQHRGIGEVEAELVALMIAAAHGMDTSDYTIPYVAGWASSVDGKNPIQVIRDTGERVRRTAKEFLDQLDTIQLGNGQPLSLRIEGPEQSAAGQTAQQAPKVEPLPEREPQTAPVAAGRGL